MAILSRPLLAPTPLPLTIANLLLATVYFTAAKFGLLMAVPHANVTAIWPSSGIALAAVILYGYRLLPGIALGAFAANAATTVPVFVATGIAIGNTLEALVGVYLLQRVVESRPSLARLKDILGLFGLTALGGTAVGATVGTLSLSAGGSLDWAGMDTAWTTWWMGDALGIIIVTPLVLVWVDRSEVVSSGHPLTERILLLAVPLSISMIVFHGSFVGAELGSSFTFLLPAAMVWAALRLSRREVVTAMFVVAAIAVWGTIRDTGPFASELLITRLVLLDGFLGVLAFMTLALSVSREAETAARGSERHARQLAEGLPQLVWACQADGPCDYLSPQWVAYTGIPAAEQLGFGWLQQIHPDDREHTIDAWNRAVHANAASFDVEFRIRRADGLYRWFKGRATPLREESGRIVKWFGTNTDINDRKRVEQSLFDSEKRLRLILDSSLDAVVAIDQQGTITGWNPQAEVVFGWTREEAINRLLADLVIPAQYREAHRRGMKHFLTAGEGPVLNKRLELSAVHKDGREFPIELTISPVKLGERYEFSAFVRDINERKRAAAALQDSLNLLRVVASAARVGLVLVDAQYRYTFANEAYGELLGLRTADIVGKRVAEVLGPVYDQVRPRLERAFAGERVSYELRMPGRSQGDEDRFFAVTYESRNDASSVIYVVAVILDITERKRLECALKDSNQLLELRVAERTLQLAHHAEALQRANEALARSNLDLQQFAYIASHDLQSPLRSISGFIQALQSEYEGKLDEQGDQWIRRTVQATQKMQTLIQDLLSFSRLDSEARPFQSTQLREIFDDAVAMLDTTIRDSGARVTCGELPAVPGDRSQLIHLMQNLIDNGVKFRGDQAPRVHVSAESIEDEWVVSVCDIGIGIEPKFHQRIFEIFQRLHNSREYSGTGIGLAVCRRVVHRHGGRIWVESQPGEGSVFYFTIPQRMVNTV